LLAVPQTMFTSHSICFRERLLCMIVASVHKGSEKSKQMSLKTLCISLQAVHLPLCYLPTTNVAQSVSLALRTAPSGNRLPGQTQLLYRSGCSSKQSQAYYFRIRCHSRTSGTFSKWISQASTCISCIVVAVGQKVASNSFLEIRILQVAVYTTSC
jgi:hypothetical protein